MLIGLGLGLVAAAALQLVDHRTAPTATLRRTEQARRFAGITEPLRQIRSRPGAATLIGLTVYQYAVVGALDIVFVVIALETLGLGEEGPGLLMSFFGTGALGAVVLSAIAYRLGRLAAALSLGMIVAGVAVTALSGLMSTATTSVVPLLIGLPLLGAARFLVLAVSKVMLQRCADDRSVGGVFAVLELSTGVGMLCGSLLAQLALLLSGPLLALTILGCGYLVFALVSRRSLVEAEQSATVPVVEMSLLRRIPAFSYLTPNMLEALARQSELVEVRAQQMVIRQGDDADRFFAIMSGRFDVSISGRYVRSMERGEAFGEVALMADSKRTASIVATEPGTLLAIEQEPFLQAVTSQVLSHQAVWSVIRTLDFDEGTTPNPAPPAS